MSFLEKLRVKVSNLPVFIKVEISFLAISGLLQLIVLPAKEFGDTYRYWDPEIGFMQVFDFPEHLGAFFPSLLFSLMPSVAYLAFINFVVWLVAAVLSICIINNLKISKFSKILASAFVTLTFTSCLLLLWINTGLADSIGLSLIGLSATIFISMLYQGITIAKIVQASFVLILLSSTKPAWVLLFAPLVVIVVFSKMATKSRSIAVLSFGIIFITSTVLVLFGVKQQYVEGLTYEGWWSFTRAAHLGEVPELQAIAELEITKCPQIADLYSELRSSQTWDGMTTSYPEILESCPGIIEYLNDNHNSVVSIAYAEPKAYFLTSIDWIQYLSKPALQYSNYDQNQYFPMNLVAPIFGSGLVHSVLISAFLILILYRAKEKVTTVLILLSTFLLFSLTVPTDGLEPVRHSSPFALFSILSVGLLLFLGTTTFDRKAKQMHSHLQAPTK